MPAVRAHARTGTRGVRRYARAEVRASPLHGRGGFALEDIPKGTIITDGDDPRDIFFNWGVPVEHAARRDEFIAYMNRQFAANPRMIGIRYSPDTPVANVMSPMRDPRHGNAWFAMRNIRRGEELLV